jgi:DUF4097 and DUF4098 domain-containing protein YvlB
VTYKGPESKKKDPDVTVEVKNGELRIVQEKMNFFYLFSWNFTQRLVEIQLPESYIGKLSVLNKSGNLTIDGDYAFESYHSDVTSGNVTIGTLTTSDFTMRSTSGNIRIGTLKADSFDIRVTSGDTKAEVITGNGTLDTTSGNVVIAALNGQADLSTSSGDTTVKEWKGSGSAHCSSGNITVTVSESTGDMTIGTTSGNIKVELGEKAAYQIKASCISGNVNSDIPLTYTGDDKKSEGDFGTNPQTVSLSRPHREISASRLNPRNRRNRQNKQQVPKRNEPQEEFANRMRKPVQLLIPQKSCGFFTCCLLCEIACYIILT